MCLFVCPLNWSLFSCNVLVCKTNWIKIIIFMSWNVNNWSLAPQLKEIFSYSNPNISLDQHSTRAVKKWWLGATMHILRGLKQTTDGWFLHTRTAFVFRQNRLIFHAYIHFKTLILLFKSFHEFFCHKNTLFSSYNFFLLIPYLPRHVKLQSCV